MDRDTRSLLMIFTLDEETVSKRANHPLLGPMKEGTYAVAEQALALAKLRKEKGKEKWIITI